jgi:hypothetical protein
LAVDKNMARERSQFVASNGGLANGGMQNGRKQFLVSLTKTAIISRKPAPLANSIPFGAIKAI